jgi:outer membrane protein assembly factor BamB/predicted Ser/Thr protein kinase
MSETTQFTGIEGDNRNDRALKGNAMLLDRYKIMGVIGGGGMGTVYQARDMHFPDAYRLAAIKEMQTMATDPTLRQSTLKTFQREANILATLSHPAIPKIYDFFDDGERAYLVMEFINGSDLELLLQKTKELPVEKIVDWAINLCDVLHYLHSHEPEPIVFRDMKPSNVMIDSRGNVRLIDFGIAKTFVSGVKHTMIGTEGYSAPEQYKGDVTPLSDIYSLGATLHHVLSRKDPRLEPPFSFAERPLREINPKIPQALADIIERSLSFDVKNRFQSCAEMKEALESLRARPQGLALGAIPSANALDTTTGYISEPISGAIQPRWKFKSEDEIRSSPTVMGSTVYVGSYDTNLWALNLENGELVWKHPTNGGIASSPITDETNKTVLFGSEDGSFYSVDARTGRISWSYQTQGRIRCSPQLAHGHVFFGSDDGKMYCLNAANGRHLWNFDASAPVRSRPYVTNDLIIFGADSGEIVAAELSGGRKWSYRAKRAIMSAPVVDSDHICYFGSSDMFFYAIDATSGYSVWRFRTNGPIISSPAVSNGNVVFGSADGFVYCLSTQSGRERWKFKTEKPIVASPVIARGTVYIGGTDNVLYALNIDSGRELWHFTANGPITSAPHISRDIILVGSMDHTLYALPLVG